MFLALLALLPWILLATYMALGIRAPRALPPSSALGGSAPTPTLPSLGASAPTPLAMASAPPPLPVVAAPKSLPMVSVVVPARNEARNIAACLGTLAAQDYPRFDLLVVDDDSEDETAAIARAVAPGRAREIRVIAGEPLPDGWFGKPWACFQGARAARGDLLLFTDADTRHAPDLLTRCVAGLLEDGVAALSPVGRQELGGFGERLVQPHMFALLGLRYPSLDRPVEPGRWRDAILSGQYTLVRREAYESIGGHEAVQGEVVEDLRLAQELVRAGHRISVRGAEETLSTRMYHSLGELIEGWSKNVATGARQVSGSLAPLAAPAGVAFLVGAWILPPVVLAAGALGWILEGSVPFPSGPIAMWSAGATGVSLVLWTGAYRRFGAPVGYAFLYPLGAGVAAFICLRSWIRGDRRIEWRGRTYSRGRAVGGDAETGAGTLVGRVRTGRPAPEARNDGVSERTGR